MLLLQLEKKARKNQGPGPSRLQIRYFRRTPQLVGSFEALRFIEAEEKKEK